MLGKKWLLAGYCTAFMLLLFAGCSNPESAREKEAEAPGEARTYLFLSHTFQYGTRGNEVDHRLRRLDLSRYDELWLGGDLCSETTLEKSTLDKLDSLFDLSSENTHWTVGNHDLRNGHPQWIAEKTGRPSYYAHTAHGITRLVLNTCLLNPQLPQHPGDSLEAERQWELITAVTDTLRHSSHLVLLMHHMTFGAVDWEMNSAGAANSDQKDYSFRKDPGSQVSAEGAVQFKYGAPRPLPTVSIHGWWRCKTGGYRYWW